MGLDLQVNKMVRRCYTYCNKCGKETESRLGMYLHYNCQECGELTGFTWSDEGTPHTWEGVDLDNWMEKSSTSPPPIKKAYREIE